MSSFALWRRRRTPGIYNISRRNVTYPELDARVLLTLPKSVVALHCGFCVTIIARNVVLKRLMTTRIIFRLMAPVFLTNFPQTLRRARYGDHVPGTVAYKPGNLNFTLLPERRWHGRFEQVATFVVIPRRYVIIANRYIQRQMVLNGYCGKTAVSQL